MKFKQVLCAFGVLAFGVIFSSCSDQQAANKDSAAPIEANRQAAVPMNQPAPTPGLPQGKVLETFDSGGYTYVRIDNAGKEIWAAVPQSQVTVGEEVALAGGQAMSNFHSKSLDRTFDEIIFSGGLIGKGQEGDGASFQDALQSESGAAMTQELSMGSSKAVIPLTDLKIEKAEGEGSYTIGELFGKAADLNGKKVRVKGQVVKFTGNIMGTNWLHLQDGSGDPEQKTHDLVVTSSEQAENGDVVTIEGVLAANKDFGYGYKYNVIVEDVQVMR
jgi:hypothetical protein